MKYWNKSSGQAASGKKGCVAFQVERKAFQEEPFFRLLQNLILIYLSTFSPFLNPEHSIHIKRVVTCTFFHSAFLRPFFEFTILVAFHTLIQAFLFFQNEDHSQQPDC